MTGVDTVRRLLDETGYSAQRLELELGAADGTVAGWLAGRLDVGPVQGKRLAEVASRVCEEDGATLLSGDEVRAASTRRSVERALSQIREALHRRGRLSSRHEALDEVSRLLFAHVVSRMHGQGGVTWSTLSARGDGPLAGRLNDLVREGHIQFMPESLAHDLSVADFELRIRDGEDALAQEIVEAFEHIDSDLDIADASAVGSLDILNDAFGRFMADSFVDEKELGQYLTPPEVVKFMVRLAIAHLTPDERRMLSSADGCHEFGAVMDPSCGVGSFLTEFVRTAQSALAPAEDDDRRRWTEAMCLDVVRGIDKSERMIRLALAGTAMFGLPAAHLHLANALARGGVDGQLTKDLEGTAGLILTNPPFGATFLGEDLRGYRLPSEWATRAPASVDSELLFFERYVDWLRPGGQLLAVVPDSILTNRGLFSDLRSSLAPSIDLVSVTSLPSVTFAAAGTTTKTSVLHLRKRPEPGPTTSPTAFAICGDIGFSVATRKSQRIQVRTDGPGELPRILDDLMANPPRARLVAGVEDHQRWDATYQASLPDRLHVRIGEPDPDDVSVGMVARLVADRVDPSRGSEEYFEYIEISDVDPARVSASSKLVLSAKAPSRARRLVRKGDILVSTVRPERKAVAVVRDHQDGSVCTTGFAVLRPFGINPYVLARLLQNDDVTAQLLRNNVGIAYPAIEESCLIAVLLPARRQDLGDAADAAEMWVDAERELRDARETFDQVIAKVGEAWSSTTPFSI